MDEELILLATSATSAAAPSHLTLSVTSKIFLGFYNALIIFIGFFGNIIVLYCSVKHGAISLDETTLALIENLALADILISVLYYLPMLVTLCFGKWVFGPELCWFVGFFSSHVPFLAEILVILAISCYRVWVIKTPERRKFFSVTHVKILLSFIWIIVTIPVVYWICAGAYAHYAPRILSCWSSNHLPPEETYTSTKIFTILFIAVPMALLFLISVKIMYTIVVHSLSSGAFMPHIRSIITVNLICWAFILSYTPLFITIVLKSSGVNIPVWFGLFQVYSKSIHVVVNPFIYVATNLRFQNFIIAWLTRKMGNGDSEDETSGDAGVGPCKLENVRLYDPKEPSPQNISQEGSSHANSFTASNGHAANGGICTAV